MLPRLEAEERLKHITDGAAAAGALERRDHKSLVDQLQDIAELDRPKPAKANPAALASMGIGVHLPEQSSAEHGDG